MTVVLLLQCRRKMAVLPGVTALMINHIVMDTWTDGSVVSAGYYGIGDSFFINCSTVILQCFK